MIFRFIRDHMNLFHVETMCRVLKVSRSGYYAWLNRPESKRKQQDKELLIEIKAIYKLSRKAYGSPRVHDALRARNINCGKKRVERLMRLEGIKSTHSNKYKATTNSAHSYPIADNILNRQFKATAPNQVWVTDITYIYTQEGWLYLAAILDIYSRKIVGWSMDKRMTSELVIQALEMAISRRKPPRGLIHHSDRGSQYASNTYQQHLFKHGFICSMNRKGNCWDNAVMESFFHTLKVELIHQTRYKTRFQARQDIFEYIEVFYNRFRTHSANGYMSPENYEKQRKAAKLAV